MTIIAPTLGWLLCLNELAGTTGLGENDPVNGGNFSAYISLVCQFAMGNQGANWGINGEPVASNLTELVSGH